MAIEGPLRELGIHDVFQLLDLSRKTGALRVTSELRHNEGKIYFDNGVVVSAEIRSNPHPLGALLLRTGKITEADLERARDMQQRQGDKRRLGEILVALGVITQREVERQIQFQIEEVVFEVMSWNEGYFSFAEEAESKVPTEVTVRIPVEALLMEGARRIDEWSRIESRIPHVGVVPSLAPPPEGGGGELDLLPPEWEVLALIDGERSVRGLATELGRSDFEVAKTLFGLESAGVIVLVDPGTAKRGRPSAAGDIAEQVAKAERALVALFVLVAGRLPQREILADMGIATRFAAGRGLVLHRSRRAGGTSAHHTFPGDPAGALPGTKAGSRSSSGSSRSRSRSAKSDRRSGAQRARSSRETRSPSRAAVRVRSSAVSTRPDSARPQTRARASRFCTLFHGSRTASEMMTATMISGIPCVSATVHATPGGR